MTLQVSERFTSTPAPCRTTFRKLTGWKTAGVQFLLCVTMAIALPAQTYTVLVNFNGANGSHPGYGSLVQGPHGKLYGTTSGGGANGDYGTIFSIAPTRGGRLTTLHSFCAQPGCADGSSPQGGLTLAPDGNLYGTTSGGGANGNYGTIFKITPDGALTTLYSFCSKADCTDGSGPIGAPVQGTDENFYGTTNGGGANGNYGTVFKMSPSGTLTTLYSFCGEPGCADGGGPVASLIQGTDGNFYGTTPYWGNPSCAPGCGTIFRITPGGILTTLYRFKWDKGANPYGALVEGTDGSLYGTTLKGGTLDCSEGCGTVFRLSPSGTLTTLRSFGGGIGSGPDTMPYGGLVQATDGYFYGTLAAGAIFQITPWGSYTALSDCNEPEDGLIQATDGKFYGTTSWGNGTVFSFSMGFGPFVSFLRDMAKVGDTFIIVGQGLKETISVSLNGTPTSFTVKSDTWLTATVPNGATTGSVTVTTTTGTLTSNKPFRVKPQLLSFDPPNGPAGTQVTITGVSLTQTLQVGFGDHVPAQFTVNSDTQLTATVPDGAQTGRVGVQTQGGTAISSATFTVTP